VQIIPVHSRILTQMSSQLELGNVSRGLIIGQSAGEKLANTTPINNVNWSYFRINRVKTLIINIKSLKPLKLFITVSGFSFGLDLSNDNLKVP
jgi:hypothetical protein